MQATELARLDREKRRRKIMAEQVKVMKIMEEERYQAALLEKVLKESKKERAAAQELFKLKQYEEVIRLNRELRQREYEDQQRTSFMESLERDRQMLVEAQEACKEKVAIELKEGQRLERERKREKRVAIADGCESLVSLILDLVEAAHRECFKNDWKSLPPPTAREHLAAFTDGRRPLIIEEAARFAEALAAQHAAEGELQNTSPEAQVERIKKENKVIWNFLVESSRAYQKALAPFRAAEYSQLEAGVVSEENANEETLGTERQTGHQLVFDFRQCTSDILNSLNFPSPYSHTLKSDIDANPSDGRPLVKWLSAVVRALLRKTQVSTSPDVKPLPPAPLKIILSGKALSGKKTLARRLAALYGLHIIDVDVALRRALKLAKKLPPEMQSDDLNIEAAQQTQKKPKTGANVKSKGLKGEFFLGEEEVKELTVSEKILSAVGDEIDQILMDGLQVTNEIYAKLIRAEIEHKLNDWPCPEPNPTSKSSKKKQSSPAKKTSKNASQEEADPFDAEARRAELPKGGWILLGFPLTVDQYRCLESELSGFSDPLLRPAPAWKSEFDEIVDKFGLIENAPPIVEEKELVTGGANLHIRLFVPTEEVARRSIGRKWDPITNSEVQLTDFTPPKEPLAFERLIDMDVAEDPAATVVARAIAFDEAQRTLDAFASHFLQPARVNVDAEDVKLEETAAANKKFPMAEGYDENDSMPRLIEIGTDNIESIDDVFDKACQAVDLVLEAENSIREANEFITAAKRKSEEEDQMASDARKRSLEEDFPVDDPIEEENEIGIAAINEDQTTTHGNDKLNVSRIDKNSNIEVSAALTVDGTGEKMIVLPELSEFEDFVMEKIDAPVQDALLTSWRDIADESVRESTAALFVELQLRGELSSGLVKMQNEMIELLSLPDERGSNVDKFISEANNLFTHYKNLMQTKDEAKAELHYRLGQLSDALFKLSNDKRKFASSRRQKLMTSGWVEARLLELAVTYQRLVSSELKKFWKSDILLQDAVLNASGFGFSIPQGIPVLTDIISKECQTFESINPQNPGVEVRGCHRNFGRLRSWEGPGLSPSERSETDELPSCGLWSFPFVSVVFYEALRKIPSISMPSDPFVPTPAVDATNIKGGATNKNKKGKEDELAPATLAEPSPLFIGLAQARVELRTKFLFDLMRLKRWASERAHEIVLVTDSVFNQMDSWISARIVAENEGAIALEEHFGRLIEAGQPIAYRISADDAIHVKAHVNEILYNPPIDLTLPVALGDMPLQLE